MISRLARLATLLLASSLGSALFACASHGGGCYFTHADDPVVAPSSSCLVTTVENADGAGTTGGCVAPDVRIENRCASDLVLHNVSLVETEGASASGDFTVTHGQTRTLELSSADPSSFRAQGTLGDAKIEISVATSR